MPFVVNNGIGRIKNNTGAKPPNQVTGFLNNLLQNNMSDLSCKIPIIHCKLVKVTNFGKSLTDFQRFTAIHHIENFRNNSDGFLKIVQ